MKNIYFFIIFTASIFFLYGCYESEIPLSQEPSSKVDMRLIGSWKSVDEYEFDTNTEEDTEFEPTYLNILKFNEKEYLITWEEDGDDEEIKRGFVTHFNNAKIINLQDIESEGDERTFMFSKYEFNKKGNLVVSILNEDFPGLKDTEFKSSKLFYAFIQKNISKPWLFESSIEFER